MSNSLDFFQRKSKSVCPSDVGFYHGTVEEELFYKLLRIIYTLPEDKWNLLIVVKIYYLGILQGATIVDQIVGVSAAENYVPKAETRVNSFPVSSILITVL